MATNQIYNRPGRGVYVKNTATSAAIDHGDPVKEGPFVGIAIKQQQPDWDSPVANLQVIADDEDYFLLRKGEVEVTLGSVVVGDAIYITSANALTKTASGNTPFGYVTTDENTRGVRAGRCRIDLDFKPPVVA